MAKHFRSLTLFAAVGLPAGLLALAPLPAAAESAATDGWTGLYAGVTLGPQFDSNDWKASSVGQNNVYGVSSSTSKASLDRTRGQIGGVAGYNFGFNGNMLAGIEASLSGILGGNKSASGLPGAYYGLSGSSDSVSASQSIDAELLGRLGVVVDPRLMLYGTTGLSYRAATYKANCPAVGNSWCGAPESESQDKSLFGWTIGAGAEGKLAEKIGLRLEYRYTWFPDANVNFFGSNNGGYDSFSGKTSLSSQTVLLGLIYHFGPIGK